MENSTDINLTYLQPANPPSKVLPLDQLQNIVKAIDGLSTEKVAQARMRELFLDQAMNYFELGCMLKRFRKEKWYGTHGTFKDRCEIDFGFSVRKAEYLIYIYGSILEAGLTWDDIKGLGWAKASVLCSRKTDPEALTEWIDKAKSMTVPQLKSALQGLGQSDMDGVENSKNKSNLLHHDQNKVVNQPDAKAKGNGKSEHDAATPEPNDDQPAGKFPEDETTDTELEATGDDSTGSGADAVQTSTKAVPKELPEFDLDADHNSLVIGHMKKIGKSSTLVLCLRAFPNWCLSEE